LTLKVDTVNLSQKTLKIYKMNLSKLFTKDAFHALY